MTTSPGLEEGRLPSQITWAPGASGTTPLENKFIFYKMTAPLVFSRVLQSRKLILMRANGAKVSHGSTAASITGSCLQRTSSPAGAPPETFQQSGSSLSYSYFSIFFQVCHLMEDSSDSKVPTEGRCRAEACLNAGLG